MSRKLNRFRNVSPAVRSRCDPGLISEFWKSSRCVCSFTLSFGVYNSPGGWGPCLCCTTISPVLSPEVNDAWHLPFWLSFYPPSCWGRSSLKNSRTPRFWMHILSTFFVMCLSISDVLECKSCWRLLVLPIVLLDFVTVHQWPHWFLHVLSKTILCLPTASPMAEDFSVPFGSKGFVKIGQRAHSFLPLQGQPWQKQWWRYTKAFKTARSHWLNGRIPDTLLRAAASSHN